MIFVPHEVYKHIKQVQNTEDQSSETASYDSNEETKVDLEMNFM